MWQRPPLFLRLHFYNSQNNVRNLIQSMQEEYVISRYKILQRNFLWMHSLSEEYTKCSRCNYKSSAMIQSASLRLQWNSNETQILFLICTSPSIHLPSWVQNISLIHLHLIFISAEPQEMKLTKWMEAIKTFAKYSWTLQTKYTWRLFNHRQNIFKWFIKKHDLFFINTINRISRFTVSKGFSFCSTLQTFERSQAVFTYFFKC